MPTPHYYQDVHEHKAVGVPPGRDAVAVTDVHTNRVEGLSRPLESTTFATPLNVDDAPDGQERFTNVHHLNPSTEGLELFVVGDIPATQEFVELLRSVANGGCRTGFWNLAWADGRSDSTLEWRVPEVYFGDGGGDLEEFSRIVVGARGNADAASSAFGEV